MASGFLVPVLLLFAYITPIFGAVPLQATWAEKTFGPDGPWHAVQTSLGSSDNFINLYPGTGWETWIITVDYCSLNDSCTANSAGLYNKQASELSGEASAGGISLSATNSIFEVGVDRAGGAPTRWMDDMHLGTGAGDDPTVSNVSLILINSSMASYPGGQWYPYFAGCMSLGAPRSINQSFTTTGQAAINASLIPGGLYQSGETPSNSFGLHIGSVWPKVPPSLVYGGYDQNRVSGEALAFQGGVRDYVTLNGISIEVIAGESPFDFESKEGLLTAGNSSMGESIEVSVDGCSPYLSLPKSTCDNIASYLPVDYDKDLGLYIWDTKSPNYTHIVSSASALAFSFQGDTNSESVTIRVPFMHLNLTLTSPLVSEDKQYFPCYTGSGTYTLGRAFLQDAFMGGNWHLENGRWWLAQAPGPNIPTTAKVVTIEKSATSISKGGNDWETSWAGVWSTKLADVSTPSTSNTPNESANAGLSSGAKAGIAVAVAAGVLGLVGLGLFLRGRVMKRGSDSSYGSPNPIGGSELDSVEAKKPIQPDTPKYPSEVEGSEPRSRQYERWELA